MIIIGLDPHEPGRRLLFVPSCRARKDKPGEVSMGLEIGGTTSVEPLRCGGTKPPGPGAAGSKSAVADFDISKCRSRASPDFGLARPFPSPGAGRDAPRSQC